MESIKNIKKDTIFKILKDASEFKKKNLKSKMLEDKIFGLLFFEPSTRTCLSFESAIHRLGGKIIKYNSIYSSERKGESLEDTIRTIDSYVDVFIIRHPEKNIISKLKSITNKPIINAADRDGEHPTQSLLDLFTILEYYPNFPNIIAFTGDIKYSRTIHSLIYLLVMIKPNIQIYFINDRKLGLTVELIEYLKNASYFLYDNLELVIDKIDVLYVTRLQKERFNGENVSNIVVNKHIINKSKDNLIIMHPLPRNEELSTDLDDDPKSKYFEQVTNGVFVRMSILSNLFTV